jgi:hydrogenase large subunit
MSRLIVGPFNRVEGDLEVQLELAQGRVKAAWVNSPMYRGFEQMLPGKDPLDALMIVPRLCGICSVSQSVAAARALASLAGVTPPPNGLLAQNLMLATENLADHLTHFYLFFMPDFTRAVYAREPWHAEALRRFEAQAGQQARRAIAARQRWFMLLGTLGGKWPHTHAIHPGGCARPVEASERLRLLAKVREFRDFLQQQLFGAPLEEVTALDSEDALRAWLQAGNRGDFGLFLRISDTLGLDALGPGPGRFLSYGAYLQPDGRHALPRGVWHQDARALRPLDVETITEDASHAWLVDGGGPLHPRVGLTLPDVDKAGAYTWNKAPRLDGQVVECGAVARQLAAAQPLVLDAVRRCGVNVHTRVLARVVPLMEAWLRALRPGEPWCEAVPLPEEGAGVGLVEAARGSLGHWLRVERGRIARYQIVAPTSWNFSPRDAVGTPGALEAALQGAPVRQGEATPVAVQHVVRSFDPCMVCTVH